MTAYKLFREMEFFQEVYDDMIMYTYKNYCEEMQVKFDKTTKSYHVTYARFLPKGEGWHKTMMNDKHSFDSIMYSCAYGYWQRITIVELGVREHNAIHQQMKELGWLE